MTLVVLTSLQAKKYRVLVAHSSVSLEDQARIYERTNKGTRKIVISTNICETSVTGQSDSSIYSMLLFLHLHFTVPDVTAVIDSGRAKLVQFNARRALREFNDVFADTSSLRQRQGRAGRVREGICFKLYSSSAYSTFPSHAIPELRRCPLSGLMLQMSVAIAASSCLFSSTHFVCSGVTCNLATSIRASTRCAQRSSHLQKTLLLLLFKNSTAWVPSKKTVRYPYTPDFLVHYFVTVTLSIFL